MSDPVLDELLASEGLSHDGLDDLVAWAKERAAELAAEAAEDPELGPLLSGSVMQGENRPISTSDATTEPRAPVQAAVDEFDGSSDIDVADVVNSAVDEMLLGREEDAPDVPVRTGQTQPNAAAPADPEAALADLATPPAAEPVAHVQATPGPVTATNTEEMELDEVELLDDDELELLEEDDEELTEGSQAAAPPAPPPRHVEPAQSFGPPDGTEQVPEWKAALYSAELGDDSAAAAKIKEESYVGPMPQDLPDEEPPAQSQRLIAEEDEISQHKIDLSDLDGDPGNSETTL